MSCTHQIFVWVIVFSKLFLILRELSNKHCSSGRPWATQVKLLPFAFPLFELYFFIWPFGIFLFPLIRDFCVLMFAFKICGCSWWKEGLSICICIEVNTQHFV